MLRLLFILIILCRFIPSNGQSRAELEKQRNAALKEISETETVLENVKKTKAQSLEMLSLLDNKITLRNSVIQNLNSDLTQVNSRIDELSRQVDLLDSDLVRIKEEYGKLIYQSYINHYHNNYWMYVLASRDFSQAYKRIKYVQQYGEYRKKQVEAILGIQTDINKTLKELGRQKKDKINLLTDQKRENVLLQNEMSEKERMVGRLKSQERDLVRKLRAKNLLMERLKNEIEKLIKAEMAAKSEKNANPKFRLTPDEMLVSNNFKDNRGKLPWPLERGVITGFYGEREHPVYKGVKIINNGIDISTVDGSYARAIFDGEVRYVLPILGANYTVMIRHGNYFTLYKNLVDVKVKVGDKVKAKQVLGRVFTDSETHSTLLHVEIWEQQKTLNPETWLSKN